MGGKGLFASLQSYSAEVRTGAERDLFLLPYLVSASFLYAHGPALDTVLSFRVDLPIAVQTTPTDIPKGWSVPDKSLVTTFLGDSRLWQIDI